MALAPSIVINLPGYPWDNFPSVATIAALRAIASTPLLSGDNYVVDGGLTAADGGGGVYAWNDASLAADDGEKVIRPTDTSPGQAGRWILTGLAPLDEALADLVSPAGSSLVGFSQTTAYPAGTVGKSLQSMVSVKDAPFNAKGDEVTDDHAAIQAAAAYAISIGGSLYFPQGVYLSSGDINTTGTIRLFGDGSDISILRWTGGTNRGWVSVLNQADDVAIVEAMTWETTGTTGTGLDISYTLTGFDNRDGRRVYTDDLNMRGATNGTGWAQQMWLHNINGSRHLFFWGVGRNNGTADNAEASNTLSPYSIRIDGAEYPTDHQFVNPTWYSFNECVIGSGAVEGLTITDPVAVNCGSVANWEPSLGFGGRPGLKLTNGHMNTYKYVAKFTSVQQGLIENNEVYHNPGSASNWQAFVLVNCEDWKISGNGYYRYLDNASAFTSEAIAISGAASSGILIDAEDFGGKYTRLDRAINVDPSVLVGKINFGKTNKFNGNYRVEDITLSADQVRNGFYGVILRRVASQSIPNTTPTLIAWDGKDYDPLGLWTASTTSVTVPTGKGFKFARISYAVLWDANATGVRQIEVLRNGSVPAGAPPATRSAFPTNPLDQSNSVLINVSGGQTLSLRATQTSGGALGLQGSGLTLCSIEFF